MRIRHRDFQKGLFVVGSKEAIPLGTLRRASGIRPLLQSSIKSRWGSTKIAALSATPHSITRFQNVRYLGIGTDLIQQLITPLSVGTVLFNNRACGGGRLTFAKMIPTTRTKVDAWGTYGPEHLFVAGGGLTPAGLASPTANVGAFKLAGSGEFTKWGIDPPPGLFRVGKIDANDFAQTIDSFDSLGGWSNPTGAGGAIGLVSNNKQQGSASMQFQVPANAQLSISKTINMNLATLPNGVESPDQDWIQFWVFCDQPKNIDNLEILFDVGAGVLTSAEVGTSVGLNDLYSFQLLIEDSVTVIKPEGITDSPQFADNTIIGPRGNVAGLTPAQQEIVRQQKARGIGLTQGEDVSAQAAKLIVNDLGTTKLASTATTWTLVRIPKSSFTASGQAGKTRTWANVRRVRFSLRSNINGTAIIYLDGLVLHIGVGMMGDYQCAYTYKNSRTGNRSNPSQIVTVKGVKRDPLFWSGLVISPDPQVDTMEFWRTVGGGNILLHAEDTKQQAVHNADIVADAPLMQSDVRTAFTNPDGSPRRTQYLGDEQLPYDNAPPAATIKDVAGPLFGRLFWLDAATGNRGRVFFSPPGRAEATEGFVDACSDDEALQRVILWNGVFAFSKAKLYELAGTQPQGVITVNEVFGVPGTTRPNTVVACPYGIIYQADDGVRVFDGTGSRLVAPEGVSILFRGESAESNLAFSGLTACYHNDEYIIASLNETLALNLRTGVWREVGIILGAAYHESETGKLIVGASSKLLDFELPGTLLDDTSLIAFDVEVPGTLLEEDSGATKIIQRLFFDIDPGNQTLAVTVSGIVSQTNLAILGGVGRQLIEFALAVPIDVVSTRIVGSLNAGVEIYGVEYDVHMPEEAGALT